MNASELKPGIIVRGPVLPEPVEVLVVTPLGEVIKIVGAVRRPDRSISVSCALTSFISSMQRPRGSHSTATRHAFALASKPHVSGSLTSTTHTFLSQYPVSIRCRTCSRLFTTTSCACRASGSFLP